MEEANTPRSGSSSSNSVKLFQEEQAEETETMASSRATGAAEVSSTVSTDEGDYVSLKITSANTILRRLQQGEKKQKMISREVSSTVSTDVGEDDSPSPKLFPVATSACNEANGLSIAGTGVKSSSSVRRGSSSGWPQA